MTESPVRSVLVVEDQALLAKVIEGLLGSAGFSVETAEHGAAAIEKLRAASFDAVITDLMMPVMDGVELLGWIREEARLDVPVVVLSANSDARHTERLRELGVQAVLRKPLDMDHFVDQIRLCLERND